MPMNTQMSQRRVNSTRSSVFMSKEISTLYQLWVITDTLILSTTETWSSRHQMEERLRSGISINNLWLSEQDTTTNHGISRMLEELLTCKSGALTQDGSKSSSTRTINSSTGNPLRCLMCLVPRTRKDKLFKYTVTTVERTNNGMSFILTRLMDLKLRDSTKTLVSMWTDHSTSDQECQCRELLNA
jgi:hypothetical protein